MDNDQKDNQNLDEKQILKRLLFVLIISLSSFFILETTNIKSENIFFILLFITILMFTLRISKMSGNIFLKNIQALNYLHHKTPVKSTIIIFSITALFIFLIPGVQNFIVKTFKFSLVSIVLCVSGAGFVILISNEIKKHL